MLCLVEHFVRTFAMLPLCWLVCYIFYSFLCWIFWSLLLSWQKGVSLWAQWSLCSGNVDCLRSWGTATLMGGTCCMMGPELPTRVRSCACLIWLIHSRYGPTHSLACVCMCLCMYIFLCVLCMYLYVCINASVCCVCICMYVCMSLFVVYVLP